jgi:plastocyanin
MTRNLKGVLLTLALTAVAGCGGGDAKKPAAAAPAAGGDAKKPAAAAPAAGGAAYDAAKSTASVKITVKWGGAKPTPVPVSISGDAFCVDAHKAPVMREGMIVGDDGSLPHSFVWAIDGPHKGMTGFPEPKAFVLDQKGCMYVPHVFGLRAGQTFTVKNSDGTTHNVHSHPKVNKDFNVAQSKDAQNEFSFTQKERAIPFNCDIHSWMGAIAFVLDHPFFGTTDSAGTVTISGLPAGKYKFKVWHESFTTDRKEYETDVEVELTEGQAVTKEVTLK